MENLPRSTGATEVAGCRPLPCYQQGPKGVFLLWWALGDSHHGRNAFVALRKCVLNLEASTRVPDYVALLFSDNENATFLFLHFRCRSERSEDIFRSSLPNLAVWQIVLS